MLAAWYERPGPAAEVLEVGEMAEPEPSPGEVRVRVALSGVNPGDTKKRGDWLGYGMPFPRIVPHSDGCGVATVIGTVVRESDLDQVDGAVAHAVALSQAQPEETIRAHAPEGVHRIIEVSFSENADLDAAVAASDAVIASYATRRDRPDFPFWPMLFANLTIRLLGSDDFPRAAKRQAAVDLTTATREGALSIPTGDPMPLDRIAEAHDRVDAGTRERVLLAIPS